MNDPLCTHPVLDPALDSACASPASSASSSFMSSTSDDDDDTRSSSTSSLSESPLDNLTSLYAVLPIKRGLSRYFSGKSQSFSSLARVSSVEELAKPENPYAKKRRMGVAAHSLLQKPQSYPPRCASSAGMSKRLTTCNRNRSLKSMPRVEDALRDGHAEVKPFKCFSVPEF